MSYPFKEVQEQVVYELIHSGNFTKKQAEVVFNKYIEVVKRIGISNRSPKKWADILFKASIKNTSVATWMEKIDKLENATKLEVSEKTNPAMDELYTKLKDQIEENKKKPPEAKTHPIKHVSSRQRVNKALVALGDLSTPELNEVLNELARKKPLKVESGRTRAIAASLLQQSTRSRKAPPSKKTQKSHRRKPMVASASTSNITK